MNGFCPVMVIHDVCVLSVPDKIKYKWPIFTHGGILLVWHTL